MALTGGRIDDLTLANYHETVDRTSPEVVLLWPTGTERTPYFAEFGWVGPAGGTVKLPDAESKWTALGGPLAPGHPVTLTWDNGAGLTFTRTVSIDENYMFTVEDGVKNAGSAPVSLTPYGLISRTGTPHVLGYYILHEGLIGDLEGSLKEVKYSALAADKPDDFTSTGGWVGFTDKYWLTAVIPPQDEAIKAQFRHSVDANKVDRYQTDYTGAPLSVPAGGTAANSVRFFAGAKEFDLLRSYEATGIPHFTLAIDFGWFWFLTKPIFMVLQFFYGILGNFGLAILLLTFLIKLAFFPLANKSYAAMSKMKLMQPETVKIREKYPDDKAKQQQEIMALYKKVGANPLAGCLPIVIQIPVFFSLYKVLFVTIEMRHAPFFGWIHDLSAPDPTSFANLFQGSCRAIRWRSRQSRPFPGDRRMAAPDGRHDVPAAKTQSAAGRSRAGADVHAAADRLHLHVVGFPGGAGDLLVVEQPSQHRTAMGDHAQAGRGLSSGDIAGPDDVFPARDIDAADVEAGRLLFAKECRFIAGAANPGALPPETLPEIAFIGRSNVGKSSLVNALTGRRMLARTSRTPGRTQQINFFDLGGRLMLVDLPGYGYADASKTAVRAWTALVRHYLSGRASLRRACLLIDARRGITETDRPTMALCDEAALSYQVVLTKADAVRPSELAEVASSVSTELTRHHAAHPELHLTSAEKRRGVAALRAALAGFAEVAPPQRPR